VAEPTECLIYKCKAILPSSLRAIATAPTYLTLCIPAKEKFIFYKLYSIRLEVMTVTPDVQTST
jgi:hypothetical protein